MVMERTSALYKLRRKLQALAHNIMPNKTMVLLYSRIVLGKWIDLDNPKTFNEKVSWLKIYNFPLNELVIKCADKFSVREYIREKGFGDLLVPLLGAWCLGWHGRYRMGLSSG